MRLTLQFLLSLIFFIGISTHASAQLTEENKQQLRAELTAKVNALRKEQGVPALASDAILQKAAQIHSDYMVEKGVLDHKEAKKGFEGPDDRIRQAGGKDFELSGENILVTKKHALPLNKKEISTIAEEMFQQWKISPGHYANMIQKDYTFGDFGFTFDPKMQVIYAAQVFGKRGFVVKNQLSENGFGLERAPKDCDQEYKNYSNIVTSLGNAYDIEGNQVVLKYHDIQWLKKIIVDPNDGFAVDVLTSEQFSCLSENKLDVSPVYDGTLLKPTYRDELFAGNTAQGDYRIISSIGTIPENLVGEKLYPTILLINNGKVCKTLFPVPAPSDDYPLIPIEPQWEVSDSVQWLQSGITGSEEVNYEFQRAKTLPLKNPVIKGKGEVHSVVVQAFSSIEGDETKNAMLDSLRAAYIEKDVLHRTQARAGVITKEHGENWTMNEFQLRYFNLDDWLQLPKDSLRKMENRHSEVELPWDSLLFAQRVSRATINYGGRFHVASDSALFFEGNLRTAVALDMPGLFNKAAVEVYYNDSDPAWIMDAQILEYALSHKEVAGSYAALLTLVYAEDEMLATRFIMDWSARANELTTASRSNISYLYSLLGIHFLDEWDVPRSRLARVITPEKLKTLIQGVGPKELVLDLQLTFIQYYGQINDGENTSKAFHYIADYFKKEALKVEDAVQLGYFYNSWSQYQLTVDLLAPYFERNELNDAGIFTLAQTAVVVNVFHPNKNLTTYIEAAQKANPKRWCKWMSDYRQNLRDEKIKQLYCATCQQ